MNGKSDVKRSACMLGHIIYDVDARVKKYVQFLLHRGFRVDVLCVSDTANKTDDKPVESVSLVVVKELSRTRPLERSECVTLPLSRRALQKRF